MLRVVKDMLLHSARLQFRSLNIHNFKCLSIRQFVFYISKSITFNYLTRYEKVTYMINMGYVKIYFYIYLDIDFLIDISINLKVQVNRGGLAITMCIYTSTVKFNLIDFTVLQTHGY